MFKSNRKIAILMLMLSVVGICSFQPDYPLRLSNVHPGAKPSRPIQKPDRKIAHEFVTHWMSEVLGSSPKCTISRRVRQRMNANVLKQFQRVFALNNESRAKYPKIVFREASSESFSCNDEEAVVRVLGVLIAIDSKNQLQNYQAFSMWFTVRIEQLNYQIAGFTLGNGDEEKISNFLLSEYDEDGKSEFGDATDDKLRAVTFCCLGEEQNQNGQRCAAVDSLRSAQVSCPKFGRAFGMRGMILSDLGDSKSGIRDCSYAIKLEPKNPIYYVFRALARGASGDHLGAIEDNQRALQIDPLYATALNNIGIQQAKLGYSVKAIESFSAAIGLNAQEALYYSNRAEVYEAIGRTEAAIADYSSAIWYNRDCLSAFDRRCNLLKKTGDIRGAIADACDVVRLKPFSPDSYDQRGWLYDLLGEHAKARADYANAIQLEPRCAAAYADRAYSYLLSGEPEKALPDADVVLSLGPDRPARHVLRGLVLMRLHKFDEAIPELRIGVQQMPENPICHSNLGEALAGAGRLTEALGSLNLALKIDPTDGLALHQRASVLSRLNCHREAALDLDRLMKKCPQSPELCFERAKVKLFAGDSSVTQDCVRGTELWLRRFTRKCGLAERPY